MAFLKNLNVGTLKETLAAGVKAAQDGLSSIDVNEVVQSAKDAAATSVKAAQENISNIDVNDVVQGAKDAATSGANAVSKMVENVTHKGQDEIEDPSPRKLIELLWCMAYADGVISETEQETLNELSGTIDEHYGTYQSEIENEFPLKLAENGKEFGHASAVKLEAKSIIEALELTTAEAKLLCWNLLALASSDGVDDNELDLIRFISEQAGLEASIVEELKNYSDAIIETANAREKLKQSNRSYSEIDSLISELENREQTLLEAAQSLIADK